MATSAALIAPKGRRYTLSSSAPTLIGTKGCAVMLSDPTLPAQVAKIVPHAGGYALENVSGIGMVLRLNGIPIPVSGQVVLSPRDRLVVGTTELIYEGPAATHTIAPTASPTPTPTPTATPTPTPTASPTPTPTASPTGHVASPPPMAIAPVRVTTGTMPVGTVPVVTAPVSRRPAAYSLPSGIVLRSWGGQPPATEGLVEMANGPHRIDRGSAWTKMFAGAALGAMTRGRLAMLPAMMPRDITVWYLRVRDYNTGRLVSTLMRGDPGNIPQIGDFIAAWGSVDGGNVIMQTGYNYTTDSEIRLKR